MYRLVILWIEDFAAWWLSGAIQSTPGTFQLQENKKNLKEDASIHLLGQHCFFCRAVLLQLLVKLASKWKEKKGLFFIKNF